jgi:hypothetical protein
MKKKMLLVVLCAALSVSFVAAQDINGHWTGKVMDQYNIAYDFKVVVSSPKNSTF